MCVIAWPGTWGLLFALIKTRPDASHWEMYCVVPTGAGSAFESETVSVGRPITPRRHWQKYVEPIFRFFHNASQIPKAKGSFPKCDATFESCILAQSHWEWERWIYVWHTARLIALKRIGRRLAYSPFAQKTHAAIQEETVAEKKRNYIKDAYYSAPRSADEKEYIERTKFSVSAICVSRLCCTSPSVCWWYWDLTRASWLAPFLIHSLVFIAHKSSSDLQCLTL